MASAIAVPSGADSSFSSPPIDKQVPFLARIASWRGAGSSNSAEHAAEPEESGGGSLKRRKFDTRSEPHERDPPAPSPSCGLSPGPADSNKPQILFPTALAALLAVPSISAALAGVHGVRCAGTGSDFVFFDDADVLLQLSIFLHSHQLPLYVASFGRSGLEEVPVFFSSATAILDFLRSGMDGRHVAARTLAAFCSVSLSSCVSWQSGASVHECEPVGPLRAAADCSVAKVHIGSVVCTDSQGRRISGYYCHAVESHRDGGGVRHEQVAHTRDGAAPLERAAPPTGLGADTASHFGSSADRDAPASTAAPASSHQTASSELMQDAQCDGLEAKWRARCDMLRAPSAAGVLTAPQIDAGAVGHAEAMVRVVLPCVFGVRPCLRPARACTGSARVLAQVRLYGLGARFRLLGLELLLGDTTLFVRTGLL
jgi:hypothetical protein